MTQGRKRKSVIWLTPVKEFKLIVSSSLTLAEILRRLGIQAQAGNYKTLKRRLIEEHIDTQHLPIGCRNYKGKKISNPVSLDNVLVEHSSYSRSSLKKRLLREGLLKNECVECGQQPEWNNKSLVLVLDHINGENDDNRLTNLRLLCPNCNSQQPTFCGRHKPRVNWIIRENRIPRVCTGCRKELSRLTVGSLCVVCLGKTNRKVERPEKGLLQEEVQTTNYCAVARKYGVCDNTIRKWLR